MGTLLGTCTKNRIGISTRKFDQNSLLTAYELQCLKYSWNLIEHHKIDSGVRFYVKLFEIRPAAKKLFTIFDNDEELEDLQYLQHFRKHAWQFMQFLESVIKQDFNQELCERRLNSLGCIHGKFGVEASYFTVFPDIFCCILKEDLMDLYNDDIESSWRIAFQFISKYMIHGLGTTDG